MEDFCALKATKNIISFSVIHLMSVELIAAWSTGNIWNTEVSNLCWIPPPPNLPPPTKYCLSLHHVLLCYEKGEEKTYLFHLVRKGSVTKVGNSYSDLKVQIRHNNVVSGRVVRRVEFGLLKLVTVNRGKFAWRLTAFTTQFPGGPTAVGSLLYKDSYPL